MTPAQYGRAAAHRLTTGPAMAFDLELDEEEENTRQQESDQSDADVEAKITDLVGWCKKHLSKQDIKSVGR
jgi:hypothetical protein